MVDSEGYKEVYFHEYCKSCEHRDVPNEGDPCNECLEECSNLYTHKPVNYKPKESK